MADGAPGPGWDEQEPGGWSAVELDTATADPAGLSDATLIEAIVGFDRVASWAGARQARLLAELVARRPPDRVPNADRAGVASEYAPDEVGVALTLSRGTAAARLGMAHRLVTVMPATLELWESGRIDLAKARAVHDTTVVLPDGLAAAVQARVLPRAPGQSLAQLRAALARAVIVVDPAGADERHREARKDRRVCIRAEDEGMASLWALLSATDAAGAFEWLTRLARGLGPDDPRTLDARRADLLAELLNGRLVAGADITAVDDPDPDPGDDPAPSSGGTGGGGTGGGEVGGAGRPAAPGTALRPVTPGKPLIQIVIAHSTLTGADDQPAELLGHGPIPAALGRDTVADAVWRRLVTDPSRAPSWTTGVPPTTHPPGSPTTSASATGTAASPSAGAKPPTPSWITPWPGPTAAPPARPTSTPCAGTTTSLNTTAAGGSRPTPTAGSPGSPPPGAGTPPHLTTIDQNSGPCRDHGRPRTTGTTIHRPSRCGVPSARGRSPFISRPSRRSA